MQDDVCYAQTSGLHDHSIGCAGRYFEEQAARASVRFPHRSLLEYFDTSSGISLPLSSLNNTSLQLTISTKFVINLQH